MANEVDFPWDQLDGRPLVFASLGTVRSGENAATFRTIAAACAGLDVQLVLTLGQWSDEGINPRERLGQLKGDPLVVGFVPQLLHPLPEGIVRQHPLDLAAQPVGMVSME